MRIWSLHPSHLDAKGLVALWREALLAKHVLQGWTKGYTRHPQLLRFLATPAPVAAIDAYLRAVHTEAELRGYRFDKSKIGRSRGGLGMTVTTGQLAFERTHLLNKLSVRDPDRHRLLEKLGHCAPHPLFTVVAGGIADWEKV